MEHDDVSTVERPVDAPAGAQPRRATPTDVHRALAGSGLAVILESALFAVAMLLGFPDIERDGMDVFGLWITLLGMWALATTIGPILFARFGGVPLDRRSRDGGERRAALLFGLLGGVPGAIGGVMVWFVAHNLAASLVFFAPIWFVAGYLGRLGIPRVLAHRWLYYLVVAFACVVVFAALVVLLVTGMNLA